MLKHRNVYRSVVVLTALSFALTGCGSGHGDGDTAATSSESSAASPKTESPNTESTSQAETSTAETSTVETSTVETSTVETSTVETSIDSATASVASAEPAPLWAPPGVAALNPTSASALQAALDTWVAQGKLKGLTAAVVTSQGVWSGAAGVDGAGKKLQANSTQSIMSVSKTFTSAEVVLLSSRGLIDLDKPLANYIDVPFETNGATVRQVLAMRSGFPDFDEAAYQKTIATDLTREWTLSEALGTLPKDAARIGTLGGEPRYNSVNYQLLAELVAKITGQSFAQAIRADLLKPAGLERTWVQSAETPSGPLTVGVPATSASASDLVDPAGPIMPSRSFTSFALGAGSMAADAADTARWTYLLYGGQVIDSTLVKVMEADPQPDPVMGPYALGTMVGDYNGIMMVGHAGGGLDYPYSGVVQVFAGDSPIAIAVLTPQPADHGTQIFEVFMQLHDIVVG